MPKVVVRKTRDPSLEKRTVPMLIGASKEEFHVHEEKLCANSPFFRRKLQPKRKPLDDEADRECPICHDPIELDQDSLEFCARECGRNFHSKCIKEWLGSKSTCPICRAQWLVPKLHTKFVNFPSLSEDGFGVYKDWLYNKQIFIPDFDFEDEEDEEDNGSDADFDIWLEAYFVGVEVEDNKFCQDLCYAFVQIFKQINYYPAMTFVEDMYAKTTEDAPLRAFLVKFFTQYPKHTFTNLRGLTSAPAEFLVDVLKAGFKTNAKEPSDWDLEEVQRATYLDVHVKPRAS